MGRDIKFRAWDSVRKKMHTSAKWVEFRFDGEGKLKAVNYHPNGDEQRLPAMQFTGLLDANGVEIYEGDIVECDEHFYYEISWSEKYHSWHASECGGLVDLPAEIKVIGNIYEHPHLLDGSK